MGRGFDVVSLFIRLDCSFFRHRKTIRLRSLIGDAAFWVPPALWVYAAEHQPDGDFSGYTDKELELAICYTPCVSNAPSMLQAMLQAGFLDADMKVHDWSEHNGYHQVHKEKARAAANARWGKERTKETSERREENRGEERRSAPSNACSNAQASKPSGVPVTEKDAIEWAGMSGVPPEFAQGVYQQCEGIGWLDAANRQIVNWRAYVSGRYSRTKIMAANGSTDGKELSVFEIKEIVKVKEERAAQIKERFSTQGPVSTDWSDETKRKEWIEIRTQIKNLKSKIEARAS